LAADLKNELSDAKGFSERNILRMLTFYKEYQSLTIGQLPVAKLQSNEIQLINPKKYFGIDLGYTLV